MPSLPFAMAKATGQTAMILEEEASPATVGAGNGVHYQGRSSIRIHDD